MEIIYLISAMILLITFILVKKTNKKINILSFLSISIVTLFCYNAFVCYILTFFVIPIKLWLLSLINLVIAIIFIIKIIKDKQMQQYKFCRIDILYIAIIAIIVLIISYINFGFPFDVNYQTGDPSVHYLTSVMFAESDALLAGVENDQVYGTFNARKTVSYVNSGLLMKCLCNNLEPIDCYNIFVLFGILVLLLTGVTTYSALINFAKKSEHRIWALIISLICILGYPLNSFLFGFEYMSIALLIICATIDLMNYYDKKLLNIGYFMVIMFLLNFGLFASYFMFVPFVFPAIWIYFWVKNYRQTKKIFKKEVILLWIITLIIPFILGFIYHVEPRLYSVFIKKNSTVERKVEDEIQKNTITNTYSKDKVTSRAKTTTTSSAIQENTKKSTYKSYSMKLLDSQLAIDGYIYINTYSNMLLLIPLALYLLFKDTKNNNLSDDNLFLTLLLTCLVIFILLLMIGHSFDKVSLYYLSKNYFVLWIVLLYCNYKALILLSEKNKLLPSLILCGYVVLMIIYTICSNVKLDYVVKGSTETPLKVMDIFGANKTILLKDSVDLNQDELEIIKYAKNNLDYNSEIEIVADEQPNYWIYVLLRYINEEEATKKYYGQTKLNNKRYLLKEKINKVDYVIYFNKSITYQVLEHRLFENSKIIYENSAGGILKYNK